MQRRLWWFLPNLTVQLLSHLFDFNNLQLFSWVSFSPVPCFSEHSPGPVRLFRPFQNLVCFPEPWLSSSTRTTISLLHFPQVMSILHCPWHFIRILPHTGQLTYLLSFLSIIIKILLVDCYHPTDKGKENHWWLWNNGWVPMCRSPHHPSIVLLADLFL